jgi:hypothetical protein
MAQTTTLKLSLADQLSPDEARILTDQIKSTAEQLWALLLEAYERKAWSVLGYDTFISYAKAEFGYGQSHAYRLLDARRVVRHLEQVVGSPLGEYVSEREARDIKPHLDLVAHRVTERIGRGDDPVGALRDVIDEVRPLTYLYQTSRKIADRSNRMLESVVIASKVVLEGVETIDFSEVDQSQVGQWAHELRQAAREISRFAARIEPSRTANGKLAMAV